VMRVVLSGASRGIGRATALASAARGAKLTLLGRPSLALDSLERELALAGAFEEAVSVELSEPRSVQAASGHLHSHGPYDAVVHAAGIVERSALLSLDLDSLRRQHEVNFFAPLTLSRAVLPKMIERGRGRILFVSSISASLATPAQIAYNSSKAALTMAMRCLAEELSDTGVMTAAIHPGAVDTDMLKGGQFPPRMTAAEVAKTLAFLLFDASAAHNGAVVEMHGT
jgi:NAD(P)-dependent dehydrogenase (short-subunit alcohol dehydrogenase family)